MNKIIKVFLNYADIYYMKIILVILLLSVKSIAQVNITVIDQGIDKNHPWFKDVKSISTVMTEDKSTEDEVDGHGTHVAGIIVKNSNPKDINLHIVKNQSESFLKKARSLPLFDKSLNDDEWGGHLLLAVKEAIKNKTNIINLSQIILYATPQIQQAIELAKENNILIIAASGNKDFNLTLVKKGFKRKLGNPEFESGSFPCSFQMDNVICVGNYEKIKKRVPISNFGKDIIDVWAYGNEIVSACVGGKTNCVMSGTSMSSPRVSAKIAKIWNQEAKKRKVSVESISYLEIKNLFINSLKSDSNLLEFSKNGKYLD